MNQDDLLALIGRIYDAGMEAERWPDALEGIADAFAAREASLCVISPNAPRLLAPRSDPAFLRSYGEHYHPLNLFWHGMTRAPVGAAVTDSMVVDRGTLEGSTFFNEWSMPQGYRHVMGATLLAERDLRVEFVLPGREPFQADHLKLYGALAPHLTRAIRLGDRLQAVAAERTWSLAALQASAEAVIIAGADARIVFANAAAESALRNGLTLSGGRLGGELPEDTAALHRALAAAPLDAARDRINLSRHGRAPLSLLVVPLRAQADWAVRHPGAAIIFITDPERPGPGEDAAFGAAYGLTPAEAALVRRMVRGGTVKEAAGALGIAVATARTHLHRVFAKTGTRNQAALMRLVLARPPGATPQAPEPARH